MDSNISLREDDGMEPLHMVQTCTAPSCVVKTPSEAHNSNGALHFINPLYELYHGPDESLRASPFPKTQLLTTDHCESSERDRPLTISDPAMDNRVQLTAAEPKEHAPAATASAVRAKIPAASVVVSQAVPRHSGHHEDIHDGRGDSIRADVSWVEPDRLALPSSCHSYHGLKRNTCLTSQSIHLSDKDIHRNCLPERSPHQHYDTMDTRSSMSYDPDSPALGRKRDHHHSVCTLASVSSHASSGSSFSFFHEFDFTPDSTFAQSIRRIMSKSKIKQNFMKGVNAGVHKLGGTFGQHIAQKAEANRVIKKILNLAHSNDSYFGMLMRSHLSHIEKHMNGHESAVAMLQIIRNIMTLMKNYVLQSSEFYPILTSSVSAHEKDVIVEKAICKCILKPLKDKLDQSIRDYHVKDGSIKQLRSSCEATQNKTLEELGVTGKVPNENTLEMIRQGFANIEQDYLPLRKIKLLLKICKVIYKSMEDGSDSQLGADEFMPVLTYVLVRCDIEALQQDVDYMTELMEPCMIHGEGQYYLISIQGVLYLLEHVETDRCSTLFRSGSLGQWNQRVSLRSRGSLHRDQHSQESNSTLNSEAESAQSLRTVAMEEINSLCSEHFRAAPPGNDGASAGSSAACNQSSDSSSSSIDTCA